VLKERRRGDGVRGAPESRGRFRVLTPIVMLELVVPRTVLV
jgi:hypothetical protein